MLESEHKRLPLDLFNLHTIVKSTKQEVDGCELGT